MTRCTMVWFASFAVLVAAGCGPDRDVSRPALSDASVDFDAGPPRGDEPGGDEPGGDEPGGDELMDADVPDAEQGGGEDADLAEDAASALDAQATGSDPDAAASADAQTGAADADAADANRDAATPADSGASSGSGATGDAGDASAASDAGSGGAPGDASGPAPGCDADNAGIRLPPGFCASRFAEGLRGPRHMVVTPAGDLFVANAPRQGASPSFVGLRDADGDGKAEQREEVGDLPGNGIDWQDGYLYFAAHASILRYALPSGALAPSEAPVTIVRDLPATPDHYLKAVVVSGRRLYVSIGSESNSCQQDNRALESPGIDPCPELATRAGVWLFDAAGEDQVQDDGARFATGTRNANALALDAQRRLFAAQNSRDQLHESWPDLFTAEDDVRLPAEGIFRLRRDDDYGWPYCYYDDEANQYFLAPEYGGDGEIVERCADVEQPIATLPAHWAPLGMAFSYGDQLPERYRRGAFIANHGSRFTPDASEPLPGYNVVFIPFTRGGRPAGPFERFAEGFAGPGRPLPDNAQHRPVGVAVAPDGALFVSDDKGGTIYRIVYRGE